MTSQPLDGKQGSLPAILQNRISRGMARWTGLGKTTESTWGGLSLGCHGRVRTHVFREGESPGLETGASGSTARQSHRRKKRRQPRTDHSFQGWEELEAVEDGEEMRSK